MTDGGATFTVTFMPPTSLRADGPEPPSRLACRQAHPTFDAPPTPGPLAPAYPVDARPPGSALPAAATTRSRCPRRDRRAHHRPRLPGGHSTRGVAAARPAGPGPHGYLRIGDRERQLVADELRAHFTAGRIDIDEFSSRLGEVWAATTATDLWTTLRQLPPVPGQPRPWDVPRAGWSGGPTWPHRRPPPRRGIAHGVARAHLRTYVTVAAILVAIWLLTTPDGYFWPAWPLLFWGWFVFIHQRLTWKWEEHRRARRAEALPGLAGLKLGPGGPDPPSVAPSRLGCGAVVGHQRLGDQQDQHEGLASGRQQRGVGPAGLDEPGEPHRARRQVAEERGRRQRAARPGGAAVAAGQDQQPTKADSAASATNAGPTTPGACR